MSTKELYWNFKAVWKEIEAGNTVIVLKHSKPVFKIVPFEWEPEKKKYKLSDIWKFTFKSKNSKENNLAENFKKYIY